jgi:negative regulator of replication initiation
LTRAQLKAYEARRSVEMDRGSAVAATDVIATRPKSTVRRVQALSRAEEYAIIRSDLKRLLWILAVLAVVLVILTIILR